MLDKFLNNDLSLWNTFWPRAVLANGDRVKHFSFLFLRVQGFNITSETNNPIIYLLRNCDIQYEGERGVTYFFFRVVLISASFIIIANEIFKYSEWGIGWNIFHSFILPVQGLRMSCGANSAMVYHHIRRHIQHTQYESEC